MTLNEYQKIAYLSYFGRELPRVSQLINNALGLVGETGEVVDQIKKEIYLNREISEEEIIEELGDVLWHLSCLAAARGVTLESIAIYNIEKLKERYPNANWGQDSDLGL